MLVYALFIQNSNVKTELRLSQELAATKKVKDVFNVLADLFKKNELDWSMLAGCTTVGAPAMLGQKSEFQVYVKNVAANATFVHCFINRFALCAKVLPSELMSCLNKIIKIVNVIKTSALNSRLFARFCEDVCSKHKCIFSHPEVRCFSRENMTRMAFELRYELFTFFREKNHEFKEDLENDEFISRLTYLSDIFQALNLINLSFQGSSSNIAVFISKLEAFIRELDVWTKKVKSKQFGMFRLLTTLSVEPNNKLSQEIEDHLKLLQTDYFPDTVSCTYAVNQFCTDPALLLVGTGEQEENIDIQVDDTAQQSKAEETSDVGPKCCSSTTGFPLYKVHGDVSKGSDLNGF